MEFFWQRWSVPPATAPQKSFTYFRKETGSDWGGDCSCGQLACIGKGCMRGGDASKEEKRQMVNLVQTNAMGLLQNSCRNCCSYCPCCGREAGCLGAATATAHTAAGTGEAEYFQSQNTGGPAKTTGEGENDVSLWQTVPDKKKLKTKISEHQQQSQQPQQSHAGWKTAAKSKKEEPAPPHNKDILLPEGFSAPVKGSVLELRCGEPGICLCSVREAKKAMAEMTSSAPLAILAPKGASGDAEETDVYLSKQQQGNLCRGLAV